MIACTCTGNVKQVPLRVVNLFEICIVRYRFNSLLRWNHFIVAGHHHNGPEFQTLGKMHGADRSPTAGGLNIIVEHLVGELRIRDRRASPVQFGRRTDEDADFVRNDTLLRPFRQPLADSFELFLESI
jgi:hypothetical protein